jgi:alkylated DNA repair dioxygenase AlkB
MAMFGYEYKSTGRQLGRAEPFPAQLLELAARAGRLGSPPRVFDQCIATEYPPRASIGWHTDAPSFAGCIAGVSLGSDATILFRPRGTSKATDRLVVTPGRSIF